MIEDMTIRRLKERTQDFYQRAVAKYAQHFRTSPAELGYEHVRQYQLHLVQSGWKTGYVNRLLRTRLEAARGILLGELSYTADLGANAGQG